VEVENGKNQKELELYRFGFAAGRGFLLSDMAL
jgi:hypothetical protein